MLPVNLYSSIELRHFGIWFLNRKAFDILTDELKTTFNLMSLLQVRNISISCLFTWRDICPRNSNDIVLILISISKRHCVWRPNAKSVQNKSYFIEGKQIWLEILLRFTHKHPKKLLLLYKNLIVTSQGKIFLPINLYFSQLPIN